MFTQLKKICSKNVLLTFLLGYEMFSQHSKHPCFFVVGYECLGNIPFHTFANITETLILNVLKQLVTFEKNPTETFKKKHSMINKQFVCFCANIEIHETFLRNFFFTAIFFLFFFFIIYFVFLKILIKCSFFLWLFLKLEKNLLKNHRK